jgi:hypothetical protein
MISGLERRERRVALGNQLPAHELLVHVPEDDDAVP